MPTMFDDLIPNQAPSQGGGMFDDLIPSEPPESARPMVPTYISTPDGEEIRIDASNIEQYRDYQRRMDEAQAEEQAEFEASRTPGRRIADTAAFAASAPVRIVTRGEYGLGDVIEGVGAEDAGEAVRASELDFARANKSGLDLAGAVGDVTMGIPFLSTMGAPARGLSATARTLANQPRRAAKRIPIRSERLDDVAAFERSDVQPFGPALTEAGSAAAVKQLSEAPIVGQPLRTALERTVRQTKDAGERVASRYGTARNYRDAGLAAERGLERFKDARPESVVDTAVSAMDDTQIANIIARRARDTSAKTRLAAMFERAWRLIPEEMALGRSVDRATTAARKSGAKLDQSRILGGLKETRSLLKEFADEAEGQMSRGKAARDANPSLAYPVRGGQAGEIIASIIEGRWQGSLQSMRNVRSNIRRLTSGIADTEKNVLSRAQMQRIQAAITRDMTNLIERNIEFYSKEPSRKFRVSTAPDGTAILKTGSEIANDLRKSVTSFKRADQATRRNAELLEKLGKFYKTDNPEALARSILRDAQGGTKGNYNRLFSLKRALRDEEWNDVSSGIIREMGTPVRSARGLSQEVDFSVNTFLTNWRGLSPEAKQLLFGGKKNAGHMKALEDFARVADRVANFEALVNNSRTATNLIAAGVLGGGAYLAVEQLPELILGALGIYGLSAFLASPAYVRWLTRAINVGNNPGRLVNPQTYLKELAKIAARDPGSEAKFVAQNLLREIGEQTDAALNGQANRSQPNQQAAQP